MTDYDNERRYPPPPRQSSPQRHPQRQVAPGVSTQSSHPRHQDQGRRLAPPSATAGRSTGSDIHERFIDLWQEARLAIWRAKHSKAGPKLYDPVTGKSVQTFVANDRLVLQALDTTHGILDSLVKLRKRWA